MDKNLKQEFIDMLKRARGTENEWAVIMAMVDMLEDDDEFGRLAEIYKGRSEYAQFLTEHEALKVVDGYVAFDGMRGAKWQPAVLFDAVEKLGGKKSEAGKYNCWALYALMNGMHSDYGGALSAHLAGDEYALTCYLMALAWMNDRDHDNDVREYYGLH